MQAITIFDRVLEEVKLIPKEKLPEFLEVIHSFRAELQSSTTDSNRTDSFAGCWRDMPDDLYNEFTAEITERRQAAFSGRRDRETLID